MFVFAGMVVAMKMLHGDLEQVKKEEPVLTRGMAITRKLGFSDVIMPGTTSAHMKNRI